MLFSSLYLQICIFFFCISKYLNFAQELWPEVQVQISETMWCLHPITLETSEIDSKGQSTPVAWFRTIKVPLWWVPLYWPILVCSTHVQVKTRCFKKFKINISTCRIQTKLSTQKRLNTRSISLWMLKSLEDIQVFYMKCKMFGQAVSKYTIVLVCVMLWRHLTPHSKGYVMRISTAVFVLKGGKYLPRYFKFSSPQSQNM